MLTSLIEGIRSIRRGNVNTEDGRQAARIESQIPVVCSSNRPFFPATVVDVSLTGMRLETSASLTRGERFWVAFRDSQPAEDGEGGALEVEVVWTRNRSKEGGCTAGLRYREPAQLEGSWVQLLLTEAGLSEGKQRRKHIRLTSEVRAEVLDDAGYHLVRAQAVDVSMGGAQLRSSIALEEGQPVTLMLAPGEGFPSFTCSAQVLRSRYQDQQEQHVISVQFADLSAKPLATLKQLVGHLLRQRAKS